jgi:oxygen-dependent protoporphyrinogen oxidase
MSTAVQEASVAADHAPSVAIIGGGISGLATAYELTRLAQEQGRDPIDLHVLEAGDRPGGKIQTDHGEGYTCEWGPNGFLDKEPATLELCQRLDLQAQLQPAAPAFNRRYIYRDGRLRAVDAHPLKFLASPLLPAGGKLRLMCEPFVRKRRLTPTDDESVASFARRRIGRWGADLLIDAMQSGIYAGDPARLSVKSCFPRVVEVEQEFGSLVRGMIALKRRRKGGPAPGSGPTGHLTSFRGGIQTLTDRLAEMLGERVQCNTAVEAIRPLDGGYELQLSAGESRRVEHVILACPAPAAATLLTPIDDHLGRLIDGIEYAPLAVLCLGWQRSQVSHPLDGFGFLAPRREGLRALGVLFTSTIFPDRAPSDHVLMRVMLGGARDAQILELDDDDLTRLTLSELEPVLGLSGIPQHVRLFRHARAIPQYNVGHSARLRRIEQRLEGLPGLQLTGNAYHGIGVNDCIRNARAVAARVLDR